MRTTHFTSLEPLPKYTVLRMRARAEKVGSIFLPDRAQETSEWGEIIAAGNECFNLLEFPYPRTEGLLRARAGTHIIMNGRDYIVAKGTDVLAIREFIADEANP